MSLRDTILKQGRAEKAARAITSLPKLPDHIKYRKTGSKTKNTLIHPAKPLKPMRNRVTSSKFKAASLPTTFDWRTQTGTDGLPLLTAIQDQGQCGCCYVFASADALANRFSIASLGADRPVFSPQDMINCGAGFVQDVLSKPASFTQYDIASAGQYDLEDCNGGLLTSAADYLVVEGAVKIADLAYSSYGGTSPASGDCAAESTTLTRYYASDSYAVVTGGEADGWTDSSTLSPQTIATNVENMMADIMQNGPVIAGIDAYDDFMIYPANGQVYEKSTSYTVNGRTYQNTLDGGHAVQIVGWDTMADSSGNATPVWIIKNQWTTQWGINGYGYIRRGTNEILIEQDVLANMPQLTTRSQTGTSSSAGSSSSVGSSMSSLSSSSDVWPCHSPANVRASIIVMVVLGLLVLAGIGLSVGLIVHSFKKSKALRENMMGKIPMVKDSTPKTLAAPANLQ